MAQKEFIVSELFVLKTEIEELLKLELPFVVRYKIYDLNNKVLEKVKVAEKAKEELIRKFGEANKTNPEQIEVMQFITDEEGKSIPNPKFEEFVKEFTPILEQKETIEYKELKLSNFENLNTDKNFQILFELISE